MTKEEIFEILDELVVRLEGPAAQIYELAFGANLRGAIWFVSLGVFLLLIGTAAFIFAIFNERKANAARSEDAKRRGSKGGFEESTVFANVIGSSAMIIGGIMTILATYDLLTVGWRTLQQIVPGL